jgi:diphosphomevalonate decarboxylase
MGSGSACRSVYGHYVLWGNNDVISKSMNSYAAPLAIGLHPLFADIQDSILVIDRGEKPVSSRAGHEKMNVHPFKKGRMAQASENLRAIIKALVAGDWNLFSRVTENEALTLHSLMMSSDPGFLLMQPNTIRAIEKINAYRTQNNVRITYTLDAGPNLHVLYPLEDKEKVQAFIHEELAEFCDNNYVIHDRIGNGPVQIL